MQLLRVMRVLIIDDSPTIRLFLAAALQKTGFRFNVESAHDGGEAIRAMQANVYDMIFIDLNMPVASGVEVLALAKQNGQKTFAVAMSDHLDDRNSALLKAFGAYDFLRKPFSESDIRRLLSSYFVINMPHEVLLVDDSATVRGVVKKILAKSIFKMNVTEAGNADEAFQAMNGRNFRIVFSDLNMPGMNGIELTRTLTEGDSKASVILMSTEISPELDDEAREAGAMAYLKKPFSYEDVDAILHHAFGLPHGKFSKSVKLFSFEELEEA